MIIILIIRKPNKKNYNDLKVYQLIALLNIMRKLLELIIARKLLYFIKTYYLLLNS